MGWGWGVITRIKANLSSTELGLTSQLELSLAKTSDNLTSEYNKQLYSEHISTYLKSADLKYINPKAVHLKYVYTRISGPYGPLKF